MQNKIRKLVAKGIDERQNNAIYIGVSRHGEREFQHYGDFSTQTEPQTAIFEIGSITKTFVGILLTQAVSEGLLSLDDPIVKFRPQYTNAFTLKNQEVTIRQLATHTSGLPREDNKRLKKKLKDRKNPYKYYTKEDLDDFLAHFTLKKTDKWAYSNIGIALLGQILEDVFGKTLETAIIERICRPLGMNDTVISLSESQKARRVKAFTKKGEEIPEMELTGMIGAGGLVSTMKDMMIFAEACLRLTKSALLPSLQQSQQNQADGTKQIDMGLCWFIEKHKDLKHPIVWTGGTTVGFHTYTGMIKETGTAVVVLSTYHLSFIEILMVLLGKGPIVTDRIALEIFKHPDAKLI